MKHSSQSNVGTREYYESRILPETESRRLRLEGIKLLREKFSWRVDREIMEQMPEDMKSDLICLRVSHFLLKGEYTLSGSTAIVEGVLSGKNITSWQLLGEVSTDSVYQLISEVIRQIPHVIYGRMTELDALSFPALESVKEYEFDSAVEIVTNKLRKWQEALIHRTSLSELWEHLQDENSAYWDTQVVYSLLLKASKLSDSKREGFIRELILAIPQWLGGKVYWHDVDAIYEEVLSPSPEPIHDGSTLTDEDIPF